MSVSTGSESQIQPNRAQVGLYTPSEKYVSEPTVQGYVSPPGKRSPGESKFARRPHTKRGRRRSNERRRPHSLSFSALVIAQSPSAAHGAAESPQAGAGGGPFSRKTSRSPVSERKCPAAAPAGQVNYTVYCGRSCRAMTSMPMSLALPWPCWSSRTASIALTYVLAADIAVTQVTPRRTASVRNR